MTIGFIGTEHGLTEYQRETLIKHLTRMKSEIEELHHGDCIGAEAEVHAIAQKLGIRVVIHPPIGKATPRAFSPDPYFQFPEKNHALRNWNIIYKTDVAWFAPSTDKEHRRSGVRANILRAQRMGRAHHVFYPDGTVD